MKHIDFTPYPGMLSGYAEDVTIFVRDPQGIIWESFEGVWINA